MLTDDQLAWVAFAEETRTVLLDEDSLPELNHHSQPYVLTVERFSGLALPPPLANIYHPPLQVVYSFRATLFDAATHAFFGSTFKSPPVAATGAANNNDDIKVGAPCFFWSVLDTNILDTNILAAEDHNRPSLG